MKVTIHKQELLKGLNIAAKAAEANSSTPILQSIKFNASDSITLTGHNRIIGAEVEVFGDTKEAGAFAVDAKSFLDVVKKMPNEEIVITYKDNKLTISCKKIKINISQVTGPEEFIDLPEVGTAEPIRIKQAIFKNMITGIAFCLARTSANKAMECFNLKIANEEISVAALDGYRVGVRTLPCINQDGEASLPGVQLLSLIAVLGEKNEEMDIYICKNHVVFELESTRLIIRRIHQQFFKIGHMFSEGDIKVLINKRDFMDSLERAALIVRADKKPILLKIDDESINLYQNCANGRIEENIPVKKTGEDITIGLNPTMLLDTLKVLKQEEVELTFSTPKNPVLIQGEGYKYIILPVSLPKNQ